MGKIILITLISLYPWWYAILFHCICKVSQNCSSSMTNDPMSREYPSIYNHVLRIRLTCDFHLEKNKIVSGIAFINIIIHKSYIDKSVPKCQSELGPGIFVMLERVKFSSSKWSNWAWLISNDILHSRSPILAPSNTFSSWFLHAEGNGMYTWLG